MSDSILAGSILDTLPNIDTLLGERAGIVRRLAPLRALYGGNGYTGERLFKVEEAKIAVAVRTRLREAGEKTTEPQIDALVRTDDTYTETLTNDVRDRTEWARLEEQLIELDWRLRCRNADANLLAGEARVSGFNR